MYKRTEIKKLGLLTLLPLLFFNWSFPDREMAIENQNTQLTEAQWVDSVYNAMSPEERLGQLFMIRAHSDLGAKHEAEVERLIKEYKVGGLLFFQGTAEKQAELTNRYQNVAKTPLFIAIDGEWGLGMRLKSSTMSFPKQLMLGAIQEEHLIYKMGLEIAHHCRRLGINVNFAPVVDVNNNAANPVINMRSFGEDRYNVASKGFQYMKGLQDGSVMACAKHFPGHGDTNVDSHHDLPIIRHSKKRLDSIELYPFRKLAQNGLQSMMIAHLSVPSIDSTPNLPTTLSPPTVDELLKKELGFEGLIFTDAMEMQGVIKYHGSGEAAAKALAAGNDIILLPTNIKSALGAIKKYVNDGKIDVSQIRESVQKVLRYKYRLGLTQTPVVEKKNLNEDLNNLYSLALKRKLIQEAITLVRDDEQLVPLSPNQSEDIVSISIGTGKPTVFQETLQKFVAHPQLQTGRDISEPKKKGLIDLLEKKKTVIVSVHDMSEYASRKYGISTGAQAFINELSERTNVILILFGNPYALKYFDNVGTAIVGYDDSEHSQDLMAQALNGVNAIRGKLPITASEKSPVDAGLERPALYRLGYDLPESVGMVTDSFKYIDSLMQKAIEDKSTPGAVVLAVKEGKIVFEKVYGHHTYSKRQAVKKDDIYDLASITKIAATTISVMKLHDDGLIDIHEPIGKYLPRLKSSNKEKLRIYDIMAHRAGLRDWIPFYQETLKGGGSNISPDPAFYKNKSSDKFGVPVTSSLFLRTDYVDSIWQKITKSPLGRNTDYKYSDLGFYLLADLVREVSGKPLNQYVEETFYKPMGLSSITYNPWEKDLLKKVPPSEDDKYFRKQAVKGYVHDMGAAMLGGVSGHAGLFSSAADLAAIMQMLMNGGHYGGQRYLSAETVKLFTTRHNKDTRRGIGFDMKQTNPREAQNVTSKCSDRTFGHLGFTGTCTWADPEHQLIYVCLTNRTFPSMNNYRWGRDNYRPRIHKVLYKALKKD